MHTWQLQEAKAHLSELVREACEDGPQVITLRGEPKVVVMSKKAYDKEFQKEKPLSFVEMMRQSPFYGLDIEFERDKSLKTINPWED